MRATLGLALVLCVGCSQGRDETAGSTSASSAAAQAPNAAPPQPAALTLDPGKVKAYLDFEAKYSGLIAEAEKGLGAMENKAKAGKYAGTTGSVQLVYDHSSLGEDFQKKYDALLAEYGLSQNQVDGFRDIAGGIVARNSHLAQGAFSAIPEMEKTLEKAPAQLRAQMEASLNELKANKAKLESLQEQRQKFGNASVDAMLAQEQAVLEVFRKRGYDF